MNINSSKLNELIFKKSNKAKSERAEANVQLFLTRRVINAGRYGNLAYDDGLVWSDESDRSAGRFLHGLIFLGEWVDSIKADSTGSVANNAMQVIETWHKLHGQRSSNHHPMAFHDETTALRLANLISLHGAMSQHISTNQRHRLNNLMGVTARLLASGEFHATGNNHGMFQDRALRNYSIIADWETDVSRKTFLNLANKRLEEYFLNSFTNEGVHIENSPMYHLMISRHLSEHLKFLSILENTNVGTLGELLHKAGRYATHAVMPDGTFPPISDTQQLQLRQYAGSIYGRSDFDYAVSRGLKGEMPKDRIAIFPSSGYAIYRSSWSDANATFLIFNAAYNSGYHKHSDDLSIFIRTQGVDIIGEAGPNGYNYKDRFTRYGYSQYAHNNIVVNRKSIQRTDDLKSTVRLSAEGDTDSNFCVKGETGRLAGSDHERIVVVNEVSGTAEIDVKDSITSIVDSKYEMFWNLGPNVEVVVHGQGFEIFHDGIKLMDALIEATTPTQISVHKGEIKPRTLGWKFPSFGERIPTNVIRVEFAGKSGKLVTKFRFKNFNYRDRGLNDGAGGWERTDSIPGLNYLLKRSTKKDASLIVAFSAIGSKGDFTYNYRATLDRADVNVLYILDDFGDQGSYYLQDHGDTSIFGSVQKLIHEVTEDLGVDLSRVTTVGSSKGGTAALIHGVAAGVGRVFVGAPQVRLGYFLKNTHPNIVRFMSSQKSENPIEELDSVVFDTLRNTTNIPHLHLIVGKEDHHYKKHALPLMELMNDLGFKLDLKVLPGNPHSEIGRTFKTYLSRVLPKLVNNSFSCVDQLDTTLLNASPGSLSVSVGSVNSSSILFKLYAGSEMISQRGYSVKHSHTWSGLAGGRYRVRIYVRNELTGTMSAWTTDRINVEA